MVNSIIRVRERMRSRTRMIELTMGHSIMHRFGCVQIDGSSSTMVELERPRSTPSI